MFLSLELIILNLIFENKFEKWCRLLFLSLLTIITSVSLRHFWTISDKLYISNILYSSIGHGGGTSMSGNSYDENGQLNIQDTYNGNFSGPLIYS